MTELRAFYEELDSWFVPKEFPFRHMSKGREVIYSSIAYGQKYVPQTHEQWLQSVEDRIRAALSADQPIGDQP